jgi:sec-independent protein translocase protein TatA
MFGLGIWELLVVMVLALLLFGTHLPRAAAALGSAIRGFRREVSGLEDDVRLAQR